MSYYPFNSQEVLACMEDDRFAPFYSMWSLRQLSRMISVPIHAFLMDQLVLQKKKRKKKIASHTLS